MKGSLAHTTTTSVHTTHRHSHRFLLVYVCIYVYIPRQLSAYLIPLPPPTVYLTTPPSPPRRHRRCHNVPHLQPPQVDTTTIRVYAGVCVCVLKFVTVYTHIYIYIYSVYNHTYIMCVCAIVPKQLNVREVFIFKILSHPFASTASPRRTTP